MALSRLGHGHYGAIVHSSTAKPWEGTLKPRKTVLESLSTHLVDPKTNDELLILGTSNVSTLFAYKNLERAKAFNPTSVLLQVSPGFENFTKGTYSSSESFQNYLNNSDYLLYLQKLSVGDGIKDTIFKLRLGLLNWWVKGLLKVPFDIWRLFTPGLDSKLIHDLANDLKADIHYAGEDFNAATFEGLKQETRMDVIYPILKYGFFLNSSWLAEAKDWQVIFLNQKLKAVAEGHLNQDNVAWMTKFMELLIPHQKKILIDKRDEDIFWQVEKKMKGNRKLVLVNQWHMDGVQRFWRHYRGYEPKKGPMMHTRDLPLEEVKNWMNSIDKDREIVEKRTGFPMASHSKDLGPYWDETRSHYA